MGDVKRAEILAGALIIVGFLLSWASIQILAYSVVILGLLASIFAAWKRPISGVYLTIFFLPLTKTINLPIFGTKIAIPEILFALTFLIYLAKGEMNFKILKERMFIPLGLFLFFAVLSIFNAVSKINWAVEVATYVFLAVFFIFMLSALNDKKKIETSIHILMISLSIVIILGFIGYLLYLFGVENAFVSGFRVTSTFKAINQLSMSLFIGFFLLVSGTKIWKKDVASKLFFTLVSLLGVTVFFASGSRMAILILVPFMILYLIIRLVERRLKPLPISGLLVFALILLLIFSPVDISKNYAVDRAANYVKTISAIDFNVPETPKEEVSFLDGLESEEEGPKIYVEHNVFLDFVNKTDNSRYHQVVAFTGIFKEHPFTGVGAGNFMERIQDYSYSPNKWEMHNIFLGILAEIGIFGFLSFITFLVILFDKALKKYFKMKNLKFKEYSSMLILGLLANLSYGLVQFGLRSRHMWLCFAILAAITKYIEK